MKIIVLCSRKKKGITIGSKLIMLSEKLPFSHVAYLFEDDGKQWVSESVYPKSRTIPLETWCEHYEIVTMFSIDLNWSREEFKRVNPTLDGIEYSLIQVFWAGVEKIDRIFARLINRMRINGRKALICTERLALVLESSNTFKFQSSLDTLSLTETYKALYRIEKYGQNAEQCYNKLKRVK